MKRTLGSPLAKNVCLALCLLAGLGCQYPKDMEETYDWRLYEVVVTAVPHLDQQFIKA